MGRKRKHEDNRQVILDTAEKLFGQYGFSRTSVDDIAKAAGLGKASLYSEFASKEEMLFHVVLRMLHSILQDMEQIATDAPPEQSPLLTLKQGLLYHIARLQEQAEQHFHGEDLLPRLTSPSETNRHHFHREMMHLHQWMAARLQEAKNRGELPVGLEPMESSILLHMGLRVCFPPDNMRLLTPFKPLKGEPKVGAAADDKPDSASTQRLASRLMDVMLSGFRHIEPLVLLLAVFLSGQVATVSTSVETVALFY